MALAKVTKVNGQNQLNSYSTSLVTNTLEPQKITNEQRKTTNFKTKQLNGKKTQMPEILFSSVY